MRERIMNVMKKKEDNKGFTLVELIVVIVILAILAAILVPSLIKWIDKAKEEQLAIEARSVYMAAQGMISEAYGTSATAYTAPTTINDSSNPKLNDVLDLAGISDTRVTAITNLTYTEAKDKCKITGMTITFDTGSMTLASGTWTKG